MVAIHLVRPGVSEFKTASWNKTMIKFAKLTRANQRKLSPGKKIDEHGISFERLANGDGRYSINIMVDGQRIHRVVGKESEGVTRQQAEDLIENLRTDARHGRLNLPKARKTVLSFSNAATKYLEKLKEEGGKDINRKKIRFDLHLNPFFKETPLNKICSFDIERYKKHRLEAKAAHGTINRELASISHLLNKAIEWDWIDKKPLIKLFKETQSRITYLTIDQINRLITAAKEDQHTQVYLFIMIGLETAMRRMEILSIKLKDIDLEKRVIFIPQAKAGARQQPITSNLGEILQPYINNASTEQTYLFPANSAAGHTVSIEKSFRRVVTAAGLDPKQVIRHTLRHTAITHLVQAGVDLPTVKRISGHKTLQMVERYSHQNGQHIQTAMDKLEDRYKSVTL
jgi:integrase